MPLTGWIYIAQNMHRQLTYSTITHRTLYMPRTMTNRWHLCACFRAPDRASNRPLVFERKATRLLRRRHWRRSYFSCRGDLSLVQTNAHAVPSKHLYKMGDVALVFLGLGPAVDYYEVDHLKVSITREPAQLSRDKDEHASSNYTDLA